MGAILWRPFGGTLLDEGTAPLRSRFLAVLGGSSYSPVTQAFLLPDGGISAAGGHAGTPPSAHSFDLFRRPLVRGRKSARDKGVHGVWLVVVPKLHYVMVRRAVQCHNRILPCPVAEYMKRAWGKAGLQWFSRPLSCPADGHQSGTNFTEK